MSDSAGKDGMTNEDLAAMMQREFIAKEERDAARFEKLQSTVDEHSKILIEHKAILNDHTVILNQQSETLAEHTEILTDHGDQLISLNRKMDTEVSERDRMQKVLDDHTDQLGGLHPKAA